MLAVAVAAGVDLIISGDADLLALGTHAGIRILTPADALLAINQRDRRSGDQA